MYTFPIINYPIVKFMFVFRKLKTASQTVCTLMSFKIKELKQIPFISANFKQELLLFEQVRKNQSKLDNLYATFSFKILEMQQTQQTKLSGHEANPSNNTIRKNVHVVQWKSLQFCNRTKFLSKIQCRHNQYHIADFSGVC